jgi:hypothetical protein
MARPIRIAFVKFAGLSAGGTERWLQMMAASLPRDRFHVDFLYCGAAPYIGSDYQHADTDPARLAYMREHGVNLIEFHVGAKDVTTSTHDWVDTDFWDRFDPSAYDLVQTAKAGPAEYPYHLLPVPVVEYVTLSAGVDRGPNIARSIHLSQWQRRQWVAAGGEVARSDVIPIPAEPPATTEDLRERLDIPDDSVVAGFHQRADDAIFSPIPLAAFAAVRLPHWRFLIMGGGGRYREQAAELGLGDAVRFVDHDGAGRAISSFLNTLDVFAHGRADGETFGTVFAEAMVHGLPCLSHRSPIANAQPETMGPAGLFAADEADYEDKLRQLMSDTALRARLAAKARPHAAQYYSLERCVAHLAGIYESLVSGSMSSMSDLPLSYGESDVGLLLAGDIDDPRTAAHSVLTGGIPNEPAVALVRHMAPLIGGVVEVGSTEGLFALVAAQCGLRARALASSGQEPLATTIALNNLEDVVSVAVPRAVADTELVVLHQGALTFDGHPPVLRRGRDDEGLLDRGYRRFTISSGGASSRPRLRGAWSLWLHPAAHREMFQALQSWTAQRASQRRAALRTELSPSAMRARAFKARLALHHAAERRRLLAQRQRASSR